jgi:hypothetical protein
MPARFTEADFDTLADQVQFCLENIRHPESTLAEAGRFYEEAAQALRGHAILRLLIDADADGFANDLIMSGQSRRGWLRRCARQKYEDHFLALSRSGSLLDCIAADALGLAGEILQLSPSSFRKNDEYEDDFWYQRLLGQLAVGAPAAERQKSLDALARAADPVSARLAIARALSTPDAVAFPDAFAALLRERETENQEDEGLAQEDVARALETKVFVEGVAVLKLARRARIPTEDEYPMCPELALGSHAPTDPADEFLAP